MKQVLLLLSIGLFSANAANWAILAAGSTGFYNYRHQSDVCHSYKTLIKNGYNPDNIIVFAYNDVASHRLNPYKGELYNFPSSNGYADNVYDGCVIDYEKSDVTPSNFLNALQGKQDYVPEGFKVVNSTSADNIFIYFSDHGSPGFIAFPTSNLYEVDLIEAFAQMYNQKRYNKIVFYLETCESGSMFINLPDSWRVYALSAANPTESSWGTYCPPDDDLINGEHLGTCLGDEFSVTFMENVDQGDFTQSLQEHFETIRDNTFGSHVMQWGDISLSSISIKDFFWGDNFTSKRMVCPKDAFIGNKQTTSRWDSRENKLLFYLNRFKTTKAMEDFVELQKEIESRKQYDAIFSEVQVQLKLTGDYHFALNQKCLKNLVEIFEEQCYKFSDYGLKYVKFLGELCDHSNSMQQQLSFTKIIAQFCAN